MPSGPSPPDRPAPVRALLDLLALGVAPPAGAEQAVADRLAAAGVGDLGADGAVVLVVGAGGAPQVWSASDVTARPLGDAEAAAGAGPALECARIAHPLAVEMSGGPSPSSAWPGWTVAAARHGFGRADAVPLRLADHVVGALLLLAAPGRGPAPGTPWPGLLAAAAAGAVVHHRALRDAQHRSDQLQTALTSRIVIEQAKGMLAERGGLDVQAAFDRLRRYARTNRMRLADAAEHVVAGTAADDVLTHVQPLRRPPPILDP